MEYQAAQEPFPVSVALQEHRNRFHEVAVSNPRASARELQNVIEVTFSCDQLPGELSTILGSIGPFFGQEQRPSELSNSHLGGDFRCVTVDPCLY